MSKQTKPAPTIKAMKVLDAIYDQIEAAIINIKSNVGQDKPDADANAFHDEVWPTDEYAAIQADVAIVGSLLSLIETLKIPAKLRNIVNENTAQHWASI